MDIAIRDAIRANPTDPGLRLTLAERWGPCPERDLVEILMGEPTPRTIHAIRVWFESHAGWAPWVEDSSGDMDLISSSGTMQGWLQRAFDPRRWPDRAARHAGVIALAQRMLPNARAFLPVEDRLRSGLEEIAATELPEPADPTGRNEFGIDEQVFADHLNQEERRPALAALHLARSVAFEVFHMRSDYLGRSQHSELIEQYHVLGWSWLGLPPQRPEAELYRRYVPGDESRDRPRAGPSGFRRFWRTLFG